MVYRKRVPRVKAKRRLRKRWYVDATIGRNVPIIGGTGLRMGTGALVKRAVRRELLRNQDVKQLTGHQAYETGITYLGMDTLYVTSPVEAMVQGTTDADRTGNEAFIRYMKVKGLIGNKSTLSEVRYRVMCIASNKQYTAPSSNPQRWGGITSSFVSDGLFNSGYGVLYNATINNQNKDFKVLEDKKITIRQSIASTVKTIPFELTCKIMSKVTYSGTTVASSLKGTNYYFVIIPYSAGTATGAEVGFIDTEYLVTFTDS